MQFAAAGLIKKAELDRLRVFREESEVYAFAVPVGPERIGPSGPHDGFSLDDHSYLEWA
jgi:hypothetical protein